MSQSTVVPFGIPAVGIVTVTVCVPGTLLPTGSTLNEIGIAVAPASGCLPPEVIAHEPTKEEVEALLEEMGLAVAELKPPEPEILHLCIEGHTPLEIGNRLGWTRWRVRRVLERIGKRLRKRIEEDCGGRKKSRTIARCFRLVVPEEE